ncbi:toll-like receptor 4 [Physella acuta]|uniref:toll-like receptor 4 n=1 Tax=Physella acuta TaxID=109671 RepID=UPI0027DBE0EC|nr:toll-like receptor 4 [Physella acuta]
MEIILSELPSLDQFKNNNTATLFKLAKEKRNQNNFLKTAKNEETGVSDLSSACISPCEIVVNQSMTLLNCSYRHLQDIEECWFPSNATVLLLNNNKIEILNFGMFSNLNELKILNLSNNDISNITEDAFIGLKNLEILSMENNRIVFNVSNVFNHLKTLQKLYIKNQNVQSVDAYTNKISFPPSLVLLTWDMNESSLGDEFMQLHNLSTLILSGTTNHIEHSSFQTVPGIKELILTDLRNLTRINQNCLCTIKHLNILAIKHTPIGIRSALKLFHCLEDRNMSIIALDDIAINKYRLDVSVINGESVLSRNLTSFLTKVCVQEVTITSSYLILVYVNAMYSPTWEQCLKKLDLSENPVIGQIFSNLQFLRFSNIQYVDVSDTFKSKFRLSLFWEAPEAVYAEKMAIAVQDTHGLSNKNSWKYIDILSAHKITGVNCKNVSIGFVCVKLSASLKFVKIRRLFGYYIMQFGISFQDGYNIEYIDISECGLSNFKYPVVGLNSLKTVIVSANDLSLIRENFFDEFPLLEKIAMSTCNLHSALICFKGSRYFLKLTYLKFVDISSNSLNLLQPDTFKFNKNLKGVNLANNRFMHIPLDVSLTPNLMVLDMCDNVLTTINKPIRDKLDDLVYRNGYFKLNLDGNIFSCHCENIQFLAWLQNSLVTLDNNRNYTCMDQDGVLTHTLLYQDLNTFWRLCVGEVYFFSSLVIATTIGIGFLTFFISTKNSNYIMSYLMKLFGSFQYKKQSDYANGVFIGYADQDYKFTCDLLLPYVETTLGLKAFVRDRDLLPSSDVARGLVEAVNSSWRIILVFNENFLRADDWMWFTIRCAIYSQTPANPSRIVVMVHKQHLHHLPDELLSAVLDENVIVVSRWELGYTIRHQLRTLLKQQY